MHHGPFAGARASASTQQGQGKQPCSLAAKAIAAAISHGDLRYHFEIETLNICPLKFGSKLGICFFPKYNIWGLWYQFCTEVSEKEACSICRAFWDEFSPLLAEGTKPRSAHFLSMAAGLSKTGHEERFSEKFKTYGLAADIPMTYVDVGLESAHPILSLADTLQTLGSHNKFDMMTMGHSEQSFNHFWDRWKRLQPKHPVYTTHPGRLGRCIPIAVHCDEGTTLKKKGIMIVQFQPMMGRGTRKRKATLEEPGLNMLGNSLVSRFLWSVMLARAYGGKRKNKPLLALIGHLATEMGNAFYHGIDIPFDNEIERWFVVPLALKGDWPALAKIGSLSRTFGHVSSQDNEKAKGICHLCRADMQGFKNWQDISFENMCAMRVGNTLPWKEEPLILSAIPLADCDKAAFFRADPFHTLHKGLFGDVCANSIVSCNLITSISFASTILLGLFRDASPNIQTQAVQHRTPLLVEVCCFDWWLYDGAFDVQCGALFADLKAFCSREGLSLHLTALTRTLLGYSKSSEYPTAKLAS